MKGESQEEGEKQKEQTTERMQKKEGGEAGRERSRKGKEGQEKAKQKAGHLGVPNHRRLPTLKFRTKPVGFLGKSLLLSSPALLGWPRTFLNPFLYSSPKIP